MSVSSEPAPQLLRVQALAQSNPSQVPSQFIQPPDDRPAAHTSPTSTIPTLNLHNFAPHHRPTVAASLASVCRQWGAFHITNHNVPSHLLKRIRSLARHFFHNTTLDYKLKYSCETNKAASEGYGSKMLVDEDSQNGSVLDWRDYFDHHTFPLTRRRPENWPDLEGYREVVGSYADEMMGLAKRLLGLMEESLGLESGSFERAVEGEFYQNITVSFYPPCPQPELTLGLQTHSDMGVVTLLIQDDDVCGLEVLKDGDWVMVEPRDDDAIVVLLSDQTEIITNGEYKSAVHRAITNSKSARISVATFHDPPKEVKISPSPRLISESRPARYQEVVYGDYVKSWYTKGPGGKRNIDALKINL